MTTSVEQEDAALQEVLDRSRADLQQAGNCEQAQSWLGSHLDTGRGTDQVYQALSEQMEQASFVDKLQQARDAHTAGCAGQLQGSEVLQADWWKVPHGADGASLDESEYAQVDAEAAGPAQEPLDSYVMVDKDDVVDAIGTFVAAYLVQLPEAEKLKPEELQIAVKAAFQELRKGRVKRLWEWGRCLYRCIAFSYGAFSVYENPWLVRALLAAIWTASKVIIAGLL